MWLSDKSENLALYQIPPGTILVGGGFISVPLSAETTGFAISSLGEQIFLTTEDLFSFTSLSSKTIDIFVIRFS